MAREPPPRDERLSNVDSGDGYTPDWVSNGCLTSSPLGKVVDGGVFVNDQRRLVQPDHVAALVRVLCGHLNMKKPEGAAFGCRT